MCRIAFKSPGNCLKIYNLVSHAKCFRSSLNCSKFYELHVGRNCIFYSSSFCKKFIGYNFSEDYNMLELKPSKIWTDSKPGILQSQIRVLYKNV